MCDKDHIYVHMIICMCLDVEHICELEHIYGHLHKTYMFMHAHICAYPSHIYVNFGRYVSPGDQICWFIYVDFRPYMLVHICGLIYVGFRPYMLHIYVVFRRYMLYPPLAYMCILAHICDPHICCFWFIYVG